MDAYAMAATVDFGLDAKQGLLDLRSENARLRLVLRLFRAATKRLDFIERAQARARSNGKVRFGSVNACPSSLGPRTGDGSGVSGPDDHESAPRRARRQEIQVHRVRSRALRAPGGRRGPDVHRARPPRRAAPVARARHRGRDRAGQDAARRRPPRPSAPDRDSVRARSRTKTHEPGQHLRARVGPRSGSVPHSERTSKPKIRGSARGMSVLGHGPSRSVAIARPSSTWRAGDLVLRPPLQRTLPSETSISSFAPGHRAGAVDDEQVGGRPPHPRRRPARASTADAAGASCRRDRAAAPRVAGAGERAGGAGSRSTACTPPKNRLRRGRRRSRGRRAPRPARRARRRRAPSSKCARGASTAARASSPWSTTPTIVCRSAQRIRFDPALPTTSSTSPSRSTTVGAIIDGIRRPGRRGVEAERAEVLLAHDVVDVDPGARDDDARALAVRARHRRGAALAVDDRDVRRRAEARATGSARGSRARPGRR